MSTAELARDDADYLWSKRHDICYRTQLSALYHQKHARFFDLLEKLVKALSIAGGSAAIAKAADPEIVIWLGAAIATISATSLVFSFGERSRKHGE